MTADKYLDARVDTWAALRKFRHAWDEHGPDVDLPPYRGGIDPLHPMIQAFIGDVTDLAAWTKLTIERADYYYGVRNRLVKDPGPGIYIYALHHNNGTNRDDFREDIYIGVTRNPYLRFAQHCRRPWWPRVNWADISLIDCRWHDGPPCSTNELDLAARHLEGWLIELYKPSENRALGPVT